MLIGFFHCVTGRRSQLNPTTIFLKQIARIHPRRVSSQLAPQMCVTVVLCFCETLIVSLHRLQQLLRLVRHALTSSPSPKQPADMKSHVHLCHPQRLQVRQCRPPMAARLPTRYPTLVASPTHLLSGHLTAHTSSPRLNNLCHSPMMVSMPMLLIQGETLGRERHIKETVRWSRSRSRR